MNPAFVQVIQPFKARTISSLCAANGFGFRQRLSLQWPAGVTRSKVQFTSGNRSFAALIHHLITPKVIRCWESRLKLGSGEGG